MRQTHAEGLTGMRRNKPTPVHLGGNKSHSFPDATVACTARHLPRQLQSRENPPPRNRRQYQKRNRARKNRTAQEGRLTSTDTRRWSQEELRYTSTPSQCPFIHGTRYPTLRGRLTPVESISTARIPWFAALGEGMPPVQTPWKPCDDDQGGTAG